METIAKRILSNAQKYPQKIAIVERALGFPLKPFESCGNVSHIAMLFYTSGSAAKTYPN